MDSDAAVDEALATLGPDAPPGAFARAIRKHLGLSLKQVAEAIGRETHFTTIAKLETGKMLFTYEWARSLGGVLGVPASFFHMPYDALNTAKRVPVYTWIDDIRHRSSRAANQYTAYLTSKDDLFGMAIIGAADIEAETYILTAIINPDDANLREGGVYLIADAEKTDGMIGIYRENLGVRRMIGWPVPHQHTHFLLDDGLEVFGRVVELQRGLVSRNR